MAKKNGHGGKTWAAALLMLGVMVWLVGCNPRTTPSSASAPAASSSSSSICVPWNGHWCISGKIKISDCNLEDGFKCFEIQVGSGTAAPPWRTEELAGGPEERGDRCREEERVVQTTTTTTRTCTTTTAASAPVQELARPTSFRYRTEGRDLCRVFYNPQYPLVSFECNRSSDFQFAKEMFRCEHRDLKITDSERMKDYQGGPYRKRWTVEVEPSGRLYRCTIEVHREEGEASGATQSVSRDPYRLAQGS